MQKEKLCIEYRKHIEVKENSSEKNPRGFELLPILGEGERAPVGIAVQCAISLLHEVTQSLMH